MGMLLGYHEGYRPLVAEEKPAKPAKRAAEKPAK